MARYQKQRIDYPMGSVSVATMRPEDLIPSFTYELAQLARKDSKIGDVPAKRKTAHRELAREIEQRIADGESYYDDEVSGYDLEELFDALDEYAGPYFYFGSHPGDGSDYGFWLSETWDEDFQDREQWIGAQQLGINPNDAPLKVSDLAEIPSKFRGEVAVVNDHGNVTLYVKTSRSLREVWAIV